MAGVETGLIGGIIIIAGISAGGGGASCACALIVPPQIAENAPSPATMPPNRRCRAAPRLPVEPAGFSIEFFITIPRLLVKQLSCPAQTQHPDAGPPCDGRLTRRSNRHEQK